MDKKTSLALGRRVGSLKRKYMAQGMPEAEALERARRQARIDLSLPVDDESGAPDVTDVRPGPAPGDTRPDKGQSQTPGPEALDLDVEPEPVQDAHEAIQDQGGTVEAGPAPQPEAPPEVDPDPDEVEGMVDMIDVLISILGEPLSGRERALWRRSWYLTLRQRGIERMPWWSHLTLSAIVTIPRRIITRFKRHETD